MSPTGYASIAAMVAALHALAFSLILGPWHWKYLAVCGASGVALWGVLPMILRLRPWAALLVKGMLALVVQQTAYHLWRSKLGGFAMPIAQFASIHILLALASGKLVRSGPMTKREN
jgi:hypothetical protein